MEEIMEILTTRKAILKEQITMDKNCYGDPFLSQHSRGRVAVEEHWLEETERLIGFIERNKLS